MKAFWYTWCGRCLDFIRKNEWPFHLKRHVEAEQRARGRREVRG